MTPLWLLYPVPDDPELDRPRSWRLYSSLKEMSDRDTTRDTERNTSTFDCATGFVVRAPNEASARFIAHQNARDENKSGLEPWMNPQETICEELSVLRETGRASVICEHKQEYTITAPAPSEISVADLVNYFRSQTWPPLNWVVPEACKAEHCVITWQCTPTHVHTEAK